MRNEKNSKRTRKVSVEQLVTLLKINVIPFETKKFTFLRPLCTIKTFGRKRLKKEKIGLRWKDVDLERGI